MLTAGPLSSASSARLITVIESGSVAATCDWIVMSALAPAAMSPSVQVSTEPDTVAAGTEPTYCRNAGRVSVTITFRAITLLAGLS